jgi:hypothetical protein
MESVLDARTAASDNIWGINVEVAPSPENAPASSSVWAARSVAVCCGIDTLAKTRLSRNLSRDARC